MPAPRVRRPLAFLLAALALAAPALAQKRLALNGKSWPPYYLDDPRRSGFARELLTTCVGSLGYETRFWPLPLARMFSALRSGMLDAHVLSHDPAVGPACSMTRSTGYFGSPPHRLF